MSPAKAIVSLALVLGCVGLTGCVSVPNDRGQVSEALEQRTGHSLTNSKPSPSLGEQVRRSEKAHELGKLSPLAVQENARQLLDARVCQAELAADLRRSHAELERSVGTRPAAPSQTGSRRTVAA